MTTSTHRPLSAYTDAELWAELMTRTMNDPNPRIGRLPYEEFRHALPQAIHLAARAMERGALIPDAKDEP